MTTTEAVVSELKDDKEAAPPMGGGMGGMDYWGVMTNDWCDAHFSFSSNCSVKAFV